MTTVFPIEVKCFVCGETSTFEDWASTSSFGAPDLDGRSAELARSTIGLWVKRCPNCGYCTDDIAEGVPRVSDIVRSEAYQSQLADSKSPELANRFLCWAMISENEEHLDEVALHLLHATWACDDSGDDSAARVCRLKTVASIEKANAAGTPLFAEEPGAADAVLVDLLRRAGRFEEALSKSEEASGRGYGDFVESVLRYQKELITKEDTVAHRMDEVGS